MNGIEEVCTRTLAAMKEAMEQAGFANVTAEKNLNVSMVKFSVRGDCPCGLGTSGIGLAFPAKILANTSMLDAHCEAIRHRIKREAEKHIELDRAEGRWA